MEKGKILIFFICLLACFGTVIGAIVTNNDISAINFVSTTGVQVNGYNVCTSNGCTGDLDFGGYSLINVSKINSVYHVKSGDSSDIQTKIDLAEANGGGVVKLPIGTYNITESIHLKSNVALIGNGRNKTILNVISEINTTLSDNTTLSGVIVPVWHNETEHKFNIGIKDFSIFCNNMSQGIVLRKVQGGIINNVDIIGSNHNGLYVATTISTKWNFNNIKIVGGETGVYLDTAEFNNFNNIHISDISGYDGLLIRQSRRNNFNNFVINTVNSTYGSSYGNGIRFNDDSRNNNLNNFVIENIENAGVRMNTAYRNIMSNFQIRDTEDKAWYCAECQGNTLSSSVIFNCAEGIVMDGGTDNLISSNKIINISNDKGIEMDFDDIAPSNNVVIGNILDNSGSLTKFSYGIDLDSTCINNSFIGNIVKGYTVGVINYPTDGNNFVFDTATSQSDYEYYKNIFSNEVVGYWSLDSYSGTNVLDGGVNSIDGTAYGGYTFENGYISLDGSDGSYLEFPFDDSMNITDELTVSFWVKVSESKDTARILMMGKDEDWQFSYENDSTKIEFRVENSSGTSKGNSAEDLVLNTWYHIVGTYDSDGLTQIYKNGQMIDDSTGISGKLKVTGTSLTFGKGDNSDRYFNGSIDEVVIFNDFLSQDEIKNLYYKKYLGQESYLNREGGTVYGDVNISGNLLVNGNAITSFNDYVYLESIDDLPTCVDGFMNLAINTTYFLLEPITTNCTAVLPENTENTIRSSQEVKNPWTYTGAGDAFVASNLYNLELKELTLSAPNGRLFNINSSLERSILSYHSGIIQDTNNLGYINNLTYFLQDFVGNFNFTEGFIFENNTQVKLDNGAFEGGNNSATYITIKGENNRIQLTGYTIDLPSQDTMFLIENSSFTQGASITSSPLTGDGTIFDESGQNQKNIYWNFKSNIGFQNSQKIISINDSSNSVETTITTLNTYTKANITTEGSQWDEEFTSTYDGGITYIGISTYVALPQISLRAHGKASEEDYIFGFVENPTFNANNELTGGNIIAETSAVTMNSDSTSINFHTIAEISQLDNYYLVIKNTENTVNPTFTDVRISIKE